MKKKLQIYISSEFLFLFYFFIFIFDFTELCDHIDSYDLESIF